MIVGSHGRNSGRNLEAGADGKPMEEPCLLLAHCGPLGLLSYIPLDLPRDGTVPREWGPPASIKNKEMPYIPASRPVLWRHFLSMSRCVSSGQKPMSTGKIYRLCMFAML